MDTVPHPAPRRLEQAIQQIVWDLRHGGRTRILAVVATAGIVATTSIIGLGRLYDLPQSVVSWASRVCVLLTLVPLAWLVLRSWRLSAPQTVDQIQDSPSAIKGAEAFGVFDSKLFLRLGRPTELRQLLQHVLNDNNTVTVLLGPSGVGKTSLLRAGLEASIKSRDLSITYAEVTRVNLHAIETAITRTTSTPPGGAIRFMIIDQLEQLDPDDPQHRRFFHALETIANKSAPTDIRLIISFRDEYASTWFPWEANNCQQRAPVVTITPFTTQVAREVVGVLATEAGLSLTNALVDEVLRGATRQGGVMPVDLGMALLALYELARTSGKRELDVTDFRLIGGASGLLASYLHQHLLHLLQDARAVASLANGLLLLADPSRGQRVADWSCPGLTHTQISWQSSQREVCGGQAAAAVHA